MAKNIYIIVSFLISTQCFSHPDIERKCKLAVDDLLEELKLPTLESELDVSTIPQSKDGIDHLLDKYYGNILLNGGYRESAGEASITEEHRKAEYEMRKKKQKELNEKYKERYIYLAYVEIRDTVRKELSKIEEEISENDRKIKEIEQEREKLKEIKKELISAREKPEQFLKDNWNSNARVYEQIRDALFSDKADKRSIDIAHRVMARRTDKVMMDEYLRDSQILEIMEELEQEFQKGRAKKKNFTFNDACKRWISKTEVSASKKAEFLVVNFGGKEYMKFREVIPAEQESEVQKNIGQTSSIIPYMELAKQLKLKNIFGKDVTYEKVFLGVRPEAYQYRNAYIPAEGRTFRRGDNRRGDKETVEQDVKITKNFYMQATLMTQLQWFLLTHKNPSHFVTGKTKIKGVKLDINRPVEKVSYEDITRERYDYGSDKLTLFEILDKVDPYFNHRLPTEAEWEAMAEDANMENNKDEYVWHGENSKYMTHDVAGKKPNKRGLYDMLGNLWEWVSDYWSKYSGTFVTDPTGPTEGSARVMRGGGWDLGAVYCRAAVRNGRWPDRRYDYIGVRSVRTPK